MRIGILSDCHLESETLIKDIVDYLPDPGTVDVMTLPGDVTRSDLVTKLCLMVRDFLECPVIFTPGNHEYYGTARAGVSIDETNKRWAEEFKTHADIHFLQNDSVQIGDCNFFGSTWWTNFAGNGSDKIAEEMLLARQTIYDFRTIGPKDKRTAKKAFDKYLKELEVPIDEYLKSFLKSSRTEIIKPEHMAEIHNEGLKKYKAWFKKTEGKKVLLSHFPMLEQLAHAHYPKSAYFISGDDYFMSYHMPDLLVFGHTHWNIDTLVHEKRCVSNMLGYSSEKGHIDFRRDRVIDSDKL